MGTERAKARWRDWAKLASTLSLQKKTPKTNEKRLQDYQAQNMLTCGSARLTPRQVRSVEKGRRREERVNG